MVVQHQIIVATVNLEGDEIETFEENGVYIIDEIHINVGIGVRHGKENSIKRWHMVQEPPNSIS